MSGPGRLLLSLFPQPRKPCPGWLGGGWQPHSPWPTSLVLIRVSGISEPDFRGPALWLVWPDLLHWWHNGWEALAS